MCPGLQPACWPDASCHTKQAHTVILHGGPSLLSPYARIVGMFEWWIKPRVTVQSHIVWLLSMLCCMQACMGVCQTSCHLHHIHKVILQGGSSLLLPYAHILEMSLRSDMVAQAQWYSAIT